MSLEGGVARDGTVSRADLTAQTLGVSGGTSHGSPLTFEVWDNNSMRGSRKNGWGYFASLPHPREWLTELEKGWTCLFCL